MKIAQILPCPFRKSQKTKNVSFGKSRQRIVCKSCGATGPVGSRNSISSARSDALEKWNTVVSNSTRIEIAEYLK